MKTLRRLLLSTALCSLLAGQAHAGGGANALGGQNSSTGVVTIPPPVTTGAQFYPVFSNGITQITTLAPQQNTARCAPFNWPYAAHVDKLGLQITTAGTGPLNVALYTDGVDAVTGKHQPQTLITDPSLAYTVTAVSPISVVLGTAGVGIPLPKGITWVCVNDAAAADALRYTGLSNSSSYIASLVGSSNVPSSSNQLGSLNLAIAAGATTANWPSFAGQTWVEGNGGPSMPFFSLEVVSVP